jgi:hypothetical protein
MIRQMKWCRGGWIYGLLDQLRDEWIDGCNEEDWCFDKFSQWRMNGWVYRRMCGRRYGRMVGWHIVSHHFLPPPPIFLSSLVTTRINEMNPHNWSEGATASRKPAEILFSSIQKQIRLHFLTYNYTTEPTIKISFIRTK